MVRILNLINIVVHVCERELVGVACVCDFNLLYRMEGEERKRVSGRVEKISALFHFT